MAALTGLQVTFQEQDGRLFLWVLDQADPRRWTLTTYTPGQPEYEVYQLGDRFVWDEVTDAYFRWVSWGEPSRDGFGAMLTPDGLRIWLDDLQRVLREDRARPPGRTRRARRTTWICAPSVPARGTPERRDRAGLS